MVPKTDAKGYTFKGWTTDKDRTKFVDAKNYTVPDEDTTLYAAWADKDGNIYTPDSDATDNEGDGQETGAADKTGTSDDNKKQSNTSRMIPCHPTTRLAMIARISSLRPVRPLASSVLSLLH